MKDIPIVCPCENKCSLSKTNTGYLCDNNDCIHADERFKFPIANNIPVIVSEDKTDTVCSMNGNAIYIERPLVKYRSIKKFIIGESRVTKSNCTQFINSILSSESNPKVLVIGSGETGFGTEELWNHNNIEIHGVDIYGSNTVDLICDAHYLPLASNAYDGVWIQAVLEHVVEPQEVVNEIFRVLKENGVVYAETPFMQQVHEGAYDFTRFTVLGHRYLFKNFELIDMGGIQGPAEVFAWSTRYLVWSLSRSRLVGKLVGVAMSFVLRPVDYLVSRKSMYDASSGVYFIGTKGKDFSIKHRELVELYRGQYD